MNVTQWVLDFGFALTAAGVFIMLSGIGIYFSNRSGSGDRR